MTIAIAIIGGLVLSAIIVFKPWRMLFKNDKTTGRPKDKTDEPAEHWDLPNAWVLRPNTVGFEYVENPPGIKYLYENDGMEYYKLIEINGELKPFILPDTDPDKMYYDPKEYANLLNMDCNRKAFAWTDDLYQKISLGIMAVIIVGILISFALV